MATLERLQAMQLSWSGLLAAVAGLIALLLVRELLPAPERKGVRMPFVALLVALAVRLLGIAVAGSVGPRASTVLAVVHVVTLVLGLTALASLVVFDLGLNRRRVRVPYILRNLIETTCVAVVLVWMWKEATDDLFSVVTTSAVLAVVGLALQGTIANVFAGLSLQLDHTMALGDWIAIGTTVGRVREIKWRATTLLSKEGDTIVVPNARLLSEEVRVIGRPDGAHRMAIRVGFHYRHPPATVRRVLLDAVAHVPGVLRHPEPWCAPMDFGADAIDYELRWWIGDYALDAVVEGEVRTRIWYASRRAGLEVPYPTRTILPAAAEVTGTSVDDHVRSLAEIELFAPLGVADRELLAAGMREVHFCAGEPIIRQGDPGDSLYIITEGVVSVRLSADGLEREVATLGSGDFFGEMSLVTGEPRQATCTAQTEVACRVIDQRAFQGLLNVRPQIADDISVILASRQADLEDERHHLSVAARMQRAEQARSRLLSRIRSVFQIA